MLKKVLITIPRLYPFSKEDVIDLLVHECKDFYPLNFTLYGDFQKFKSFWKEAFHNNLCIDINKINAINPYNIVPKDNPDICIIHYCFNLIQLINKHNGMKYLIPDFIVLSDTGTRYEIINEKVILYIYNSYYVDLQFFLGKLKESNCYRDNFWDFINEVNRIVSQVNIPQNIKEIQDRFYSDCIFTIESSDKEKIINKLKKEKVSEKILAQLRELVLTEIISPAPPKPKKKKSTHTCDDYDEMCKEYEKYFIHKNEIYKKNIEKRIFENGYRSNCYLEPYDICKVSR